LQHEHARPPPSIPLRRRRCISPPVSHNHSSSASPPSSSSPAASRLSKSHSLPFIIRVCVVVEASSPLQHQAQQLPAGHMSFSPRGSLTHRVEHARAFQIRQDASLVRCVRWSRVLVYAHGQGCVWVVGFEASLESEETTVTVNAWL